MNNTNLLAPLIFLASDKVFFMFAYIFFYNYNCYIGALLHNLTVAKVESFTDQISQYFTVKLIYKYIFC